MSYQAKREIERERLMNRYTGAKFDEAIREAQAANRAMERANRNYDRAASNRRAAQGEKSGGGFFSTIVVVVIGYLLIQFFMGG